MQTCCLSCVIQKCNTDLSIHPASKTRRERLTEQFCQTAKTEPPFCQTTRDHGESFADHHLQKVSCGITYIKLGKKINRTSQAEPGTCSRPSFVTSNRFPALDDDPLVYSLWQVLSWCCGGLPMVLAAPPICATCLKCYVHVHLTSMNTCASPEKNLCC